MRFTSDQQPLMNRRRYLCIVLAGVITGLAPAASAQATRRSWRRPPGAAGHLTRASGRSRVTFRIYAPQAQAIRLAAGDIPGVGQTTQLTKGENGVWEVTIGAGQSRNLSLQLQRRRRVDDSTPAARSPASRTTMLEPRPRSRLGLCRHEERSARRRGGGALLLDRIVRSAGCTSTRHPATSAAYDKYPVFYLLHGAGRQRRLVVVVGRAGFILDNAHRRKRKPSR